MPGKIKQEKIDEQWEFLDFNYQRYMAEYDALIQEVRKAKRRGDKQAPEAFSRLLNLMANDSKLLKGCIPVLEGIRGEIGTGRRISRSKASEGLYRAIYAYTGNVSAFCRENGISRSKYYRIKNFKVSNEKDVSYLKKLAQAVS